MTDWRKGSRASTTLKNRTRLYLEEKGWRVGDVERQVTPLVKSDLFGFADLLAFWPSLTLGAHVVAVQVSPRSGRAAHVSKYRENPLLDEWLTEPTREFWLALWDAKKDGRGLAWRCEIIQWEDA